MIKLLLIVVAWFALLAVAGRQPRPALDPHFTAFLAGASAAWNPGTRQWDFEKIDPTDPDWEAAYQEWLKIAASWP